MLKLGISAICINNEEPLLSKDWDVSYHLEINLFVTDVNPA